MFPVPEARATGDPKRAIVMTYHSPGVINQATTIPGKEPTCRVGVKIAPWVNPVLVGHHPVSETSRDARGSSI